MQNCTSCKLHIGVRSNCIPCEGNASCGILLVGEAPGETEDTRNKNFVGDAGALLNRCIKAAGLNRADLGIANAVRCHPEGNEDPSIVEIDACRQHLLSDIQRLKPKVIVPMGNIALQSIMGMSGITKVRGNVFKSKPPEHELITIFDQCVGTYFIPTLHPANCLRVVENERYIIDDLAKAYRVAVHGWQSVPTNYSVVKTVDEVRSLLPRLRATMADFITFDTETTGFDYREDKVICVSLSNMPRVAWVVPIYGKDMREIWTPEEKIEVISLLKEFFESGTPFGGQNVNFDAMMLKGDLKIEVKNIVVDTMLLHHTVDETSPHDLDYIIAQHTDIAPYSHKVKSALPKGGNYSNIPEEILWPYAATDADGTHRSAIALIHRAQVDDCISLHDRIMLPLSRVMAKAEWDGIRVDMDALDRLHEEYTDKRKETLARLYMMAGREFNPQSTKQLSQVLYSELRLPIVKETSGGSPSTDAEARKKLKQYHPIISVLDQYANLAHDMSNYLKGVDGKSGMLRYIHKDGRVHPRWMLHRAVTGRLASSDPAIQNIKSGKGDSENFRPIFIATEGWCWLEADYSQAELRVVAEVSNDSVMKEMLSRSKDDPRGDIHTAVAAQINGIDPNRALELVTKDMRNSAKNVNFGIIYGRGPWTLAEECGISVKEAEKYINDYFTLFAGVKRHFDATKKLVDTIGVVCSPFHRKRRFYGVRTILDAKKSGRYSNTILKDFNRALAEMYRQGINVTVQSPANDVLGLAGIRINNVFEKYKMKSRFLISHHDAWHSEAPEDEMFDALEIIKTEMEKPVPELNDLLMPADFKVGTFWSDDSVTVKGFTD